MKRILVIVGLIFTIFNSHAQFVCSFAGSGTSGFANGTGNSAMFSRLSQIAIDNSGNIYIADSGNHRIRKITSSGVVSTFAGSGVAGFANGASSVAKFWNPSGVAVDSNGNVYVADTSNHLIRKITPSGVVSTFAGTGSIGYADGTIAQFHAPMGLAVDTNGNLYVADQQNYRVRKITPAGVVSTLAGSGINGFADGIGTAAKFSLFEHLAVDVSGNVYVADDINNRIRKITPTGTVTTIAGSGASGYSDGIGTAAIFSFPISIAVDASGVLYVSDFENHKIRKILPSGAVSTLAGSSFGYADGNGSSAKFYYPFGIAVDLSGNVFVADSENYRIRKITNSNLSATISYTDTTFCNSLTSPQNVTLTGTGAYTGGTFSSVPSGLSINASSGAITPSASTPGTYSISYSTPSNGGCQIAVTTLVTIISNPTAAISYGGNSFCSSVSSQPVIFSPDSYLGGVFSSTPTGLNYDSFTGSIFPATSLPGTYTIVYITPPNGGCASFQTSITVTILPLNTVTAPSLIPVTCVNYVLIPITYTTTGATGIGTPTGLPSGVTATWIANTITISGAPTVSGTFAYTIPFTGGCGIVNATGIITVNPDNTVSNPSTTTFLCINTSLAAAITHATTGATGIGTATGLPSGVTATWAANTITISGTPVVAGAFNYSIPLTGGCGTVNATGTIIISGNSPSSISADGTTTTSVSVNNGNTVQLQLNGFFGSPSNIQWTPNIGISSTTISNPIVYPSTTTTYTASFINSNGCLQSTSITVNVNPLPNIGNISISTTNNSVVGLFDTITVNVQLTNATDLYSLYMKLKGNAAVSQYLDYSGYVASTLLGPLPDVIATNPIVTNGEYDFGITKIGAVPGYTGSGLFYTFKFVTKNIPIPDGTVFCFYLDDVNTYNSTGTACGLTNQGQYCFTFTNQLKVWPGDLNNSNVVTTADILPIGYFYNSTGPVRPNATIQWTGQPATLWGYNHSFLNSNAYKTFADSNGDGVINNADQAAIGFNMNQVHARQASDKPFGIAPNTSNNAQVVGALNVTPNVSIINGAVIPQTVTFTVNLTNTGGLSSLYGISTNLIFDNTIFDLSTATIDYTGSIFGLVNTDCLAINYNSATGVSVGLTRYANTAINGQGLLFKVTLQTKTTLPNLPQTQVTSYVDAANNQLGNPLEIGDSLPMNFSVINVNLGVQDTVLNTFKLYPNPTKGILYFSVGDSYLNFQELKLKIVNTLGQVIDQISVKSATEEIISKNWGGAGMYFVQIETTQGEILGVKKIILQ